MTARLADLVLQLNDLLKPEEYRDYCPNGLQVEGRKEVGKLVTGVTASQAFLDAAVAAGADAVLVHHGYFWRGEDSTITGIRKQRIRTLLENDISLIAYHLPLDAHPELGNNAQLGKQLDFIIEGDLDPRHKSRVGVRGYLRNPMSAGELAGHIARKLDRPPLHIGDEDREVRTIGWCTGGAQQFIEVAHQWDVDAYLTGEVSEQTVHFARETGMQFYAAGHHATERYGALAVGEWAEQHCGVLHEFIDIDNPA